MKQVLFITIIACCSVIYSQDKYVYEIKNLQINSEFSDFGPSYFGEKLIYSSAKKGAGNTSGVWKDNKQPFLDLYQAQITDDGELTNESRLLDQINSKYHEGGVAVSNDLKTIYFTRNNYHNNRKLFDNSYTVNLGIYVSKQLENGQYSEPEPLFINNKNYSNSHPALSLDGKKLFFVSDMPGGYGKSDIYFIEIFKDGSYGKPINIGNKINTAGQESFPFIATDNVMYFSTDGRSGLGQFDIYQTKIAGDQFEEPKLLEAPINSPKDDFAFIIKNNKGYFSSNREGGKGDDDLYFFEYKKLTCNEFVEGKVVETNSKAKLVGAKVELLDDKNNVLKSTTTNENASYVLEVDCNKNYVIKVSNNGYVESVKKLTSTNQDKFKNVLNVELTAVKQEFVKEKEKVIIKINPIYFDINSSFIREDAKVELNKVVDIMIKYPDITIECGSHTDSRAAADYNMRLSEKRVQNTIKYIVSKGISSNRISGKGYGETQLINNCKNGVKCSETEHQLNRRTEFVVIQKD
ncbi:MAG: OmpA family protein [Bacteroidetes bacterium]|jgi:outer membrane protein OmpA-like peptidoglycan-associated protein|nr:OmpA family protein [Bacteroidota bacterium]